MKFNLLPLLLVSALLQACAPAGPVKFYSGQPISEDKLAIVKVPGPITVHSIDGKEIASPSQENADYELHLKPGFHLIAFKYELYWGSEVSGMMVKSKLTGVDTSFEAGKRYHINYREPRDEGEAYSFLREFKASLVENTTGQRFASYEIKDLNATLQARRTTFYNTPSSVAMINKTSPVSELDIQSVPSAHGNNVDHKLASTARSDRMIDADSAMKEDPVKRMKFWWLLASQEERKVFIEWTKTATETFPRK